MIETIISCVVPYAALGVLIGAVYFAALAWNVKLYADHGAGLSALLLHLARIVVAVVTFTLCARQGAAPLLASFAGFLAVRTISVNRSRLALARES
jgi:F1F0 ATPase subunit 2